MTAVRRMVVLCMDLQAPLDKLLMLLLCALVGMSLLRQDAAVVAASALGCLLAELCPCIGTSRCAAAAPRPLWPFHIPRHSPHQAGGSTQLHLQLAHMQTP